MCLREGSVVFVSELPAVGVEGGVLTVKFKSGCDSQVLAMPLWLVRLVHKRVAVLLGEQDAARAA